MKVKINTNDKIVVHNFPSFVSFIYLQLLKLVLVHFILYMFFFFHSIYGYLLGDGNWEICIFHLAPTCDRIR